MRACVIFNPAARGEKARHFREVLAGIGPRVDLRPTTGAGAARILAREAVEAGHEWIIAAGGDGTAFEVLNGISDAPDGLKRAVLGVLPLGTANVFAHELRMPRHPMDAWNAMCAGEVRHIDCGVAEFCDQDGRPQRACFAVVAGAGLDARAVQLVDWQAKKRFGKLAYLAAALRALLKFPDAVHCTVRGSACRGRVVLVGNGRLYAGDIPIFQDGALDSGRLHIRVVESITPRILGHCLLAYVTGRWAANDRFKADAVDELRLESDHPVPLQLDGELAGWLPATLRIIPKGLRVSLPGT